MNTGTMPIWELCDLYRLMRDMPERAVIEAEIIKRALKGGPGSGHWGHAGGKGPGRGGSRPASVALSLRTGRSRRRRQMVARAEGQGFFSGDPDKTSMAKMYKESPPDVRKMADRTGVLALDRETFEYVLSHQDELADFKYRAIRELGGQKYVAGELTYLQRPTTHGLAELSNMNLDRYYSGASATERAFLADIQAKTDPIKKDYYSRKASYYDYERRMQGVLDDMTPQQKQTMADLRFKKDMMLSAERAVNDSSSKYYAWGPQHRDLSKIEVSPDFNLRAYALGVRTQIDPATKKIGTGSMMALSAMSGAEKKTYQDAVHRNWSSHHAGFTADVNGVFKIHGQRSVGKKFQAALDARDNEADFMFHGTHYGAGKAIGSKGFKVPKKAKAGRMLGDGVYLAPQASKSMQYVGSSFGRSKESGVLLVNRAAKGTQRQWDGAWSTAYGRGEDTLYARAGVGRLLHDELVVRDPTAVLPDVWIDVTRKSTY